MNVTRDGLIVGIIFGIVLGGGIGVYTLNSKISTLDDQIDELQDQLHTQLELTEFQQEILFYQIHGVVSDYCHWPFNGTIGYPIEGLLLNPESWHPNYSVTVIQVSKLKLREEIFKGFNKYPSTRAVTVNFPEERLYMIKWGPWERGKRKIEVLYWSPIKGE